MKRNTIYSLVVIGFLSILLGSCEKESTITTEEKDPTKVLTTMLNSTQPADMTVAVSTSYGNSPYPNGNGQPWTILLGYHKNLIQVGSLTINNMKIPYSSNQYFKQTDSTIKSDLFTGVNDNISFVSDNTNLIPSFQSVLYSPSSTPLTFGGLTDYKIDRQKGISISWRPDKNYATTSSNGKSYLVVQGENDGDRDNRSKVFVKDLQDDAGSVSLSPSDLSQFNSYSSITIIYGKGCYQVQKINEKNIMIQFQNFSYSNIYFK